MDKSCFSYWRQLSSTGLACAIGASLPYLAPSICAQESVVQKEINRRAANASKANELLQAGDTAYNKKDYTQAVKDYSQAFSLLPISAKTEELRIIAGVRYATAATEEARKLAKRGDYQAAKTLLDQVLAPEIAPTHIGALKLRGQIDDPVRYNPALTPEHVKDAAKVGRNLREAEGFVSLGQYDRAVTVYRSVLQIDPYNIAARRGLEQINTIKTDYYRSAQDHTRAELLSEVDRGWELTVPAADGAPPALPLTGSNDLAPDIRDRLTGINIEVIDLDNVSLTEALDFIRVQSRIGDIPGPDGEKTGINIVLNAGPESGETAQRIAATRVTLKSRNLPLSKVLDYVTDQTATQWRTDGVGVIVTPLGSVDGAIISRTFRVPPNFLSATAAQKEEGGNIFDSDSGDQDGGLLPNKIGIIDFLKQNGITFPQGASATYTASTNTLTVRNTADNIDLVDQLVNLIAGEEPVLVKIETTIMRVSQQHLKELGFDWAITPLGFGSNSFLGGGTVGSGSALGAIPTPAGVTINSNPVTSGNRSGSGAIQGDSIDAFLNATDTGAITNTTTRAPGILALTYVGSGIQVQMLMRGLNQKTGTDILVKPSTIARSGERAKIEVLREFIYPTEYEPPELPNTVASPTFINPLTGNINTSTGATAVTPATPTAFETRNVGVTLEVEPTVGPNKKFIELSLSPELVEFEGFVNYGSPITGQSATNAALGIGGTVGQITTNAILMPVFQTTRIPNQSVTIQDGHTLVLGGLMTSRKTKVEDKTPILGDVPYLGRLFRSEAEETFNQAVIISVTVELIDPTGKPWRNR